MVEGLNRSNLQEAAMACALDAAAAPPDEITRIAQETARQFHGANPSTTHELTQELVAHGRKGLGQLMVNGAIHRVPLPLREDWRDIKSKSKHPKRMSARSIPLHLQPLVDVQIAKYLREGVWTEISRRQALTSCILISPINPRPKGAGPDGKPTEARMTNDSRCLNSMLAPVEPLTDAPHVNLIIERLRGSPFIATIDVRSAFSQVTLTEESRWATCVQVGDRFFIHNRLPQGCSHSPAIWQDLAYLIWPDCFPYVDDIAVGAESMEALARKVLRILQQAAAYNITINPKKVVAGTQTKVLGFWTDGRRRWFDQGQVSALLDPSLADKTRTVPQLRGLIGTFNYYRAFLPHCEGHLKILRDIAPEKGGRLPATLPPPVKEAIHTLQRTIAAAEKLWVADPSKPYYLMSDASDVGLGAVLMQPHPDTDGKLALRPVGHWSYALTAQDQNLNVTELEALALTLAADYFSPLLSGHLIVLTDHMNLVNMLHSGNPRVQRLATQLVSQLSVELIHIPGKDNLIADFASRYPVPGVTYWTRNSQPPAAGADLLAPPPVATAYATRASSRRPAAVPPPAAAPPAAAAGAGGGVPPPPSPPLAGPAPALDTDAASPNVYRPRILEELVADPRAMLTAIARAQQSHLSTRDSWAPESNSLYVSRGGTHVLVNPAGEILLPPDDHLRLSLVTTAHRLCNHRGVAQVLLNLQGYAWLGKRGMVHEVLAACPECQLFKPAPGTLPQGHMIVREEPPPHYSVLVDVVGPLRASEGGYTYITTILDVATRFLFAVPMLSATAADTTKALHLYCYTYTFPMVVLTDNGTHFAGEFAAFLASNNIRHHTSKAGHPQAQGRLERQHAPLVHALRALTSHASTRDKWADEIPRAVFIHNNSQNRSIKMAPVTAFLGTLPQLPPHRTADSPLFPDDILDIASYQRYLAELRSQARQSSLDAANASKEAHDRGREPTAFSKGDYVVRLLPQRRHKLGSSAVGPYVVVEATNENSYRLKHHLLGTYTEAHVQTLTRYDLTDTPERYLLDLFDDPHTYVAEAVRSHEVRDGQYFFTIKWRDYPEEDNTVEPLPWVKHLTVVEEYVAALGLKIDKRGKVVKPRGK